MPRIITAITENDLVPSVSHSHGIRTMCLEAAAEIIRHFSRSDCTSVPRARARAHCEDIALVRAARIGGEERHNSRDILAALVLEIPRGRSSRVTYNAIKIDPLRKAGTSEATRDASVQDFSR